MDCSLPAPLSMGFFKHEHWSELPFPPPGDLPDPGMGPVITPNETVFGYMVLREVMKMSNIKKVGH